MQNLLESLPPQELPGRPHARAQQTIPIRMLRLQPEIQKIRSLLPAHEAESLIRGGREKIKSICLQHLREGVQNEEFPKRPSKFALGQ